MEAGTPQTTSMPPSVTELEAIKARQQATWASGDFAVIGTTLQIVGETLCEAVDLRSNAKVLDVAAGNGNCSLAAARRWCDVTSTDYVPSLLADGRRRAQADRLAIQFQEADVERLPFVSGSFDVVLSSFGVMFAPNHSCAALEMVRVCRSGGKIGLANWTPSGFVGQLLKVVGKHVPPPAALTPPTRWGTEDHLEVLFQSSATRIDTARRTFMFRYQSAAHFVEVFRTLYGPVHKAFAALPAAGQQALEGDILALVHASNISGDRTVVIPAEYLEVVIHRQ
jgi:ubiquinone/menaquinone biosynthesis C-methylase UbiE